MITALRVACALHVLPPSSAFCHVIARNSEHKQGVGAAHVCRCLSWYVGVVAMSRRTTGFSNSSSESGIFTNKKAFFFIFEKNNASQPSHSSEPSILRYQLGPSTDVWHSLYSLLLPLPTKIQVPRDPSALDPSNSLNKKVPSDLQYTLLPIPPSYISTQFKSLRTGRIITSKRVYAFKEKY